MGWGLHADRAETSRLPAGGAANCATVGTFVGSWEAQRSGGYTRIAPRPRGSLRGELPTAQLPALSWAPGRPSGVGVTRGSRRDLAAPCGGSCQLRYCRHFSGLLGGPAEWGLHADRAETSQLPAGGAANCAIVGT